MGDDKKIYELPVDKILPNRFQPRIVFDDSQIYELSESIKLHGVFSPIIVRKLGDKYEIIAGERRYKASVLAGKETIPAIISNANDDESIKIALLENVQRTNLSPLEEAISYKKISEMENMNQEKLAKILGKTQATIANKLRLLKLSEEVQEALIENKISERHARSLLRIKNEQDQAKMLNRIISERLTVRKLDDEIDKYLKSNEGLEVVDIDDNIMQIDVPVNQNQVKNIEVEDIIMEEPKENLYNNSEEINTTNNYEQNRFFNNAYNKPEELHADTPGNVNIFNVPTVEKEEPIKPEVFSNVVAPVEEPKEEPIPQTSIFDNNFIEPVVEEVKPVLEETAPVQAVEQEEIKSESSSTDSLIEDFEDIIPVLEDEIKPEVVETAEPTPTQLEEAPVVEEISSVLIDDIPTNEIIDEKIAPSIQEEQPSINDIVSEQESIEANAEPKVEEAPVEEASQEKEMPETENDKLEKALSMFRNDVIELKKLGYKIDIDEFDLETMYQLIIKVEK